MPAPANKQATEQSGEVTLLRSQNRVLAESLLTVCEHVTSAPALYDPALLNLVNGYAVIARAMLQ